MKTVIITVEKSTDRKGFQLRHNQQHGFKGIIGTTFGWYKYKYDALNRANELNEAYNKN